MITWKPLTIRAAQLDSSTLAYPGTGETAWVTATGYVVGDTVSYTIDGLIRKFQCKAAHTSGASNVPIAYPNENAQWLDLGAVNRYAMFHLEWNSQSTGASPLVVECTPGERFGAVAFGNVVADDVRVEVLDGVTSLYDETYDLISREVYGWRDWLFQPFRQISNYIVLDLPVLTTATLKLTFTRASGDVGVGAVCMGLPVELGTTESRARTRKLNFTQFTRDEFGGVKITPRRSVPKVNANVLFEKTRLNQVRALVDGLNGVVTVWAGLSNPLDGYFNAMFLIGVYKDEEWSLDHPDHGYLNLEIEGI